MVRIDGTRRTLEMLATVSSAAHLEERDFVKAEIDILKASGATPVIQKFYDATASRMKFGHLQAQLYPHARYPFQDPVTLKWRELTLEEFLQQKPYLNAKVLRAGTLNVLAQGHTCTYMQANGQLAGFRCIARPKILQNATASCLFSATEKAVPEFSREGLQDLCRECEMVFVNEQPDGCSANRRKKAASSKNPPANLFHVGADCAAHQ